MFYGWERTTRAKQEHRNSFVGVCINWLRWIESLKNAQIRSQHTVPLVAPDVSWTGLKIYHFVLPALSCKTWSAEAVKIYAKVNWNGCLRFLHGDEFVWASCFVNQIRICGLLGLGFGVGLVTGLCHSLFFFVCFVFLSWIALLFLEIYEVRVRVVSMFNEIVHSRTIHCSVGCTSSCRRLSERGLFHFFPLFIRFFVVVVFCFSFIFGWLDLSTHEKNQEREFGFVFYFSCSSIALSFWPPHSSWNNCGKH